MAYESQKRAVLRRLHGESNQLADDIDRVTLELDMTPELSYISELQFKLMDKQLDCMYAYEDVLQKRIEALNKELGIKDE